MSVVAFTQPSTTISNPLATLQNAAMLVHLGCRPQLIQKLTSAGIPSIKVLVSQIRGEEKDRGGRHPRSIVSLIESTAQHCRASLFLRYYMTALTYYDGTKGAVHADSFIRALQLTKSEMGGEEFTPDHCYLVASLYHSREITTKHCHICATPYLYTVEPQLVRAHVTHGECPLCRESASTQRGKTVVKVPDPKTQRAILAAFQSG